MLRLHRSLVGLAVVTTLLTSPGVSRAEPGEADAEAVHSAWPFVLGGASAFFGASAGYFYLRHADLRERGEDMAGRVPAGEKPCAAGGDARFCELDRDARTASTLMVGSAVASLSLLAAATVVFVRESAAAPRTSTTVAPIAGPGIAGAVLVRTF